MKGQYKTALKEQGFTETQAEAAYETFEKLIEMELLHGDGNIALQGIGSITVRPLAAKKGRNPKTGAPIDIPARMGLKFKPSKSIIKELNTVKAPK